jgi:hypothetical protein
MNKGVADIPQPLFKPHILGNAGNDMPDIVRQHGFNRFFDPHGAMRPHSGFVRAADMWSDKKYIDLVHGLSLLSGKKEFI